jgi:diacylglycerol kinase (ATP)
VDKQKVCIIFNPAAKGEKARHLQSRIRVLTRGVRLWQAEEQSGAEDLAAQAVEQGFQIVVAAGGDGTVNSVINGIADADVNFGILPLGTMNVFASELGLPTNQIRKCWEIIRRGHSRLIDLGLANDRYFLQMAGVGLDAQAVQETASDFRSNFGPLSYILSATQIISRPPPELTVQFRDGPVLKGSFVLVGNGRRYGGQIPLFRDARNDDGKLDVLVFESLGYLDVIRYLQGIFFGHPADVPDIEYRQTTGVEVSSDRPTPVEVDGEAILETPVSFEIAPRRLRVLV